MIEYIHKNLTTVTHGIVAHGCNCKGKMGAGVAKDIKEKWPKAFDGYLYCLNQMRERHSSAALSDCHVSTLYWRSTVKATLQVSNPELKLIEMLLIQSEQLKYLDDSNTALITPEQEQQKYSTDADANTAFNYLLSKHRQFVYC